MSTKKHLHDIEVEGTVTSTEIIVPVPKSLTTAATPTDLNTAKALTFTFHQLPGQTHRVDFGRLVTALKTGFAPFQHLINVTGGGGAHFITNDTSTARDVTVTSKGSAVTVREEITETVAANLRSMEVRAHPSTPQPALNIPNNGRMAIGSEAGMHARASLGTLIGTRAGAFSTTFFTTAVGAYAGENSMSTNLTAVGVQAGQWNLGASATAIGHTAGMYNHGNFVTALGQGATRFNIHDGVTSVGEGALPANLGKNVVAVGYNSQADLPKDPARTKTIAPADVTIGTSVNSPGSIHVPAHGVPVGDTAMIHFTSTGKTPKGVSTTGSVPFVAVDANTLAPFANPIADQGTGTHTLAFGKTIENSVIIGAEAHVDDRNQIQLGTNAEKYTRLGVGDRDLSWLLTQSAPGAGDDGKVLTVVGGHPTWSNATGGGGSGLPPHTAADKGKVLGIDASGNVAWVHPFPIVTKATAPTAADYGVTTIPVGAVWVQT